MENKQFKPFKGRLPEDFRNQMISFWMDDEGYATSDDALEAYGGERFESLCNRVSGKVCEFKPDLGYADKSIDGTLCFEVEDNDFVIPVWMIEIV